MKMLRLAPACYFRKILLRAFWARAMLSAYSSQTIMLVHLPSLLWSSFFHLFLNKFSNMPLPSYDSCFSFVLPFHIFWFRSPAYIFTRINIELHTTICSFTYRNLTVLNEISPCFCLVWLRFLGKMSCW